MKRFYGSCVTEGHHDEKPNEQSPKSMMPSLKTITVDKSLSPSAKKSRLQRPLASWPLVYRSYLSSDLSINKELVISDSNHGSLQNFQGSTLLLNCVSEEVQTDFAILFVYLVISHGLANCHYIITSTACPHRYWRSLEHRSTVLQVISDNLRDIFQAVDTSSPTHVSLDVMADLQKDHANNSNNSKVFGTNRKVKLVTDLKRGRNSAALDCLPEYNTQRPCYNDKGVFLVSQNVSSLNRNTSASSRQDASIDSILSEFFLSQISKEPGSNTLSNSCDSSNISEDQLISEVMSSQFQPSKTFQMPKILQKFDFIKSCSLEGDPDCPLHLDDKVLLFPESVSRKVKMQHHDQYRGICCNNETQNELQMKYRNGASSLCLEQRVPFKMPLSDIDHYFMPETDSASSLDPVHYPNVSGLNCCQDKELQMRETPDIITTSHKFDSVEDYFPDGKNNVRSRSCDQEVPCNSPASMLKKLDKSTISDCQYTECKRKNVVSSLPLVPDLSLETEYPGCESSLYPSVLQEIDAEIDCVSVIKNLRLGRDIGLQVSVGNTSLGTPEKLLDLKYPPSAYAWKPQDEQILFDERVVPFSHEPFLNVHKDIYTPQRVRLGLSKPKRGHCLHPYRNPQH